MKKDEIDDYIEELKMIEEIDNIEMPRNRFIKNDETKQ